jgi:hypothetical protein
MGPQCPGDQLVAGAEPEAPVFDVLEMVERLLQEALVGELGSEPQVTVERRSEAARWALPGRGLERGLAANACTHRR